MTVDSIGSSVVKSEHLSAKGAKRMPDSESKKAWMKENSTMIGARLNHNTDADIVEYLKTVDSTGGTIKKALRLLIAQEAPSAAQPAEGEEEDYSWLFEDEEN